MFRRNTLAILFAWSALAALPAFSQEEFYRQEVSGQAFGSFVKETTQDGIKQKATDSGGALASYRYFFNKHNGVEANYGYSLNTQIYNSARFRPGCEELFKRSNRRLRLQIAV